MSLDLRRPALCTLEVADLERAIDFWARLGVPLKLRAGRLAELQTDTVIVQLVEVRAGGRGAEASSPAPALAWEVDDLEAARAHLSERGLATTPVALPEGVDAAAFGRRIAFEDPDAHRFELVQPR